MPDSTLSTRQAAQMAGVSQSAMTLWISQGKIPAERVPNDKVPSGYTYSIQQSDLEAYVLRTRGQEAVKNGRTLMTIEETADLLDIGRSSVYRLTEDGTLGSTELPGSNRRVVMVLKSEALRFQATQVYRDLHARSLSRRVYSPPPAPIKVEPPESKLDPSRPPNPLRVAGKKGTPVTDGDTERRIGALRSLKDALTSAERDAAEVDRLRGENLTLCGEIKRLREDNAKLRAQAEEWDAAKTEAEDWAQRVEAARDALADQVKKLEESLKLKDAETAELWAIIEQVQDHPTIKRHLGGNGGNKETAA